MEDKVTITVHIGGQEIFRVYAIEDGQAPEDMQENIQDMIDNLLNKEEEF